MDRCVVREERDGHVRPEAYIDSKLDDDRQVQGTGIDIVVWVAGGGTSVSVVGVCSSMVSDVIVFFSSGVNACIWRLS